MVSVGIFNLAETLWIENIRKVKISMEICELSIIEDPFFYRYTKIKELESFSTTELTIALSVVRKECCIKEKVFHSQSGD